MIVLWGHHSHSVLEVHIFPGVHIFLHIQIIDSFLLSPSFLPLSLPFFLPISFPFSVFSSSSFLPSWLPFHPSLFSLSSFYLFLFSNEIHFYIQPTEYTLTVSCIVRKVARSMILVWIVRRHSSICTQFVPLIQELKGIAWTFSVEMKLSKIQFLEGQWDSLGMKVLTAEPHAWVWSLGSTRWKKRTDSWKLFSDLCTYAVVQTSRSTYGNTRKHTQHINWPIFRKI